MWPNKQGREMKLQLGLNPGVSNAVYHADRTYLSSTVLKTILKDIREYKKYYIDGEEKPAPKNQGALDEGSLAHSMILEPHLVESDYAFYKGAFKRGSEYEKFVGEVAKGKPVISTVQAERIKRLIRTYETHPAAPGLIRNSEVEFTICAELAGVPVKVRLDSTQIHNGIISDVKTTGYSGEHDSFKQTLKDLEYDLSAALYTMVAEQHFGRPFDFYFIVLSKRDVTCNVYKTSKETMANGKRKVLEALDKYKRCKASGIWTDETVQVEPNHEILEV
jgi:PDDEXK-like domain of unknown function (DUF3799)